MVKKLKFDDYSAEAIHGNLRQSKRDRVIRGFRNGKNRILVATDVASRGLDIPLIQHVINYDLPQVPEDYIHRVGRTGRAGKEGSALTFLTNHDRYMWREIQKLINPNFKLEENFKKTSGKNFNKRNRSFRNNSSKTNNRFNKRKKFKSEENNSRDDKFYKKKKFKLEKNKSDKTNQNENRFDKNKNFKFKKKKFKNRKRPKKFSFKKFKRN